MKPIKTEKSNFAYRGPTPGIGDLPCERKIENPRGVDGSTFSAVYSVWEPTDEERGRVSRGANVKLGIIDMEPIPPVTLEVVGEAELPRTGVPREAIPDDRAAAIAWAREVLDDKRTVILDTETTGLQDAEFVEIGVIDRLGNTLFESRVLPTIPISDGARDVHGISNEDLVDEPAFDDVYPRLRGILKGKRVVVYNAAFDGPIYHELACRAEGIESVGPLWKAWDCAMTRYAEYVGEFSDYHGSYKWQKLEGGDHSAIGDCRAALVLIRRMARG